MRFRLLAIAALCLAVAAVYAPSLRNDFVIWDDDTLVYENPLTQRANLASVAGAFTSYDPELYVPLTILSFEAEHAVIGFDPFFYHLDNVILHACVAALMFLLLERLGLRPVTAFACALLFAIHPLNTEAAAWISSRKDLLATLFSLGAMLTYLRWRDGETRARWWTLALFLLALLSKPTAIVLPVGFILLDWLRDGRVALREQLSKAPLFALSAVFLLIGLYGKSRNIGAVGPKQTILLGIKSAVFGLKQFFWPQALSPLYLQTDPIGFSLPQFWIPALALCALAAVTIVLVRKTRVPLFALCFYLLFLVPSFSNFAKDHSIYFFSDRYVYLSQAGVLLLLGCCADGLMRGMKPRTATAAVTLLAVPVASLFAWNASAQSLLWKDSETLYRDAITKNERSATMHYNLGLLEQTRGNAEEARKEYERTLEIDPRYYKALTNLGMYYAGKGDAEKAIGMLREAAAMEPRAPEARNNIGSILMDRGDVKGAMAEFDAAIAINATFVRAHLNKAVALGKLGRYEEALREYREAYRLDPSLGEEHPEIEKMLRELR